MEADTVTLQGANFDTVNELCSLTTWDGLGRTIFDLF
jgi:hypothetical protein